MNDDDARNDRKNARQVLQDAHASALQDDAKKADALTRIADAYIRMSTIPRG